MDAKESAGWYVISLRPQGAHAALRRAAARRGARLLALSPWRIGLRGDADTRAALTLALDAEYVLFTSPTAVTAAARLQALRPRSPQIWLAVGGGTAAALRRQGVADVRVPSRMDSEGLLALPQLRALAGRSLGFVSAPDGRNLLAPTLRQRGAALLRADVYERLDVKLPARIVQRLERLQAPACLLVSSGGALDRVMAQLSPAIADDMRRRMPAIVASERLARQAEALGFQRIQQAAGPRNAQLLDAAEAALAAIR